MAKRHTTTHPDPKVTGKGDVSRFLQRGEAHALSTRDLLRTGYFQNAREITLAVRAEREQGELILSNGSGFYLPAEGETGRREIRDFVMRIRHRALETMEAATVARYALFNIPGQTSVEE